MKRLLVICAGVVFGWAVGWLVFSDVKQPTWPDQGSFEQHG